MLTLGAATIALAVEGRWLSAAAALGVAALLVGRHPRARFSAYVLLSVLAARAGLHGQWELAALGVAAIVLLQTSAAARLWPRYRSSARIPRP